MKLISLGSGGWMPSPTRHTCTHLVETDEHLILIDTGTGIIRLADYPEILARHDTLTVIYTHYHYDHTIGLTYLPRFLQGKKLEFWGPGAPYYPQGCQQLLEQFTAKPFFAKPLSAFTEEIAFHEYDESGITLGDLSIEVLPQIHADPTFGLTFGNAFHFATDTEVIEATFERAQSTQLLIHECWARSGTPSSHSSASGIRVMLEKYPVPCTRLIHPYPVWSVEEEAIVEADFPIEKNVSFMRDGMVFSFDD